MGIIEKFVFASFIFGLGWICRLLYGTYKKKDGLTDYDSYHSLVKQRQILKKVYNKCNDSEVNARYEIRAEIISIDNSMKEIELLLSRWI